MSCESFPSPDLSKLQSSSCTTGTVIEIEFIVDDLRTVLPTLQEPFDRVFHDPFSPQYVPELWTCEVFQEYYRLLDPRQGCLLTYSAAAAVRGGLIETGFALGRTIGVGDKTGGTAAWIPSQSLEIQGAETQDPNVDCSVPIRALTTWEQAYLDSRAGLPYRDPGLRGNRSDILSRRSAEQEGSERLSGAALLKQKPNDDGACHELHAGFLRQTNDENLRRDSGLPLSTNR